MVTAARLRRVLVRDLVGEGVDESPCFWRVDDLDVVGELHELTYGVDLVVADSDLNRARVARGLYGLEPVTQDAAGDVLGVRVEHCCYLNAVALFEVGDELCRECFEWQV